MDPIDPNLRLLDSRADDLSNQPIPDARPTGRTIQRLVPAVILTGLATLAIGWLAFLISRAGVAPAVLFPIGVGLAVGAAQTAIVRKLGASLPSLAAAILGLMWGGLAVATEDYSGYRDYLGNYATVQRGDRLASILQSTNDQWQPAGFPAYLSAVIRRNPVWWAIDAALTPLAAAVFAGTTSRRVKSARPQQPGPAPPPGPGPI